MSLKHVKILEKDGKPVSVEMPYAVYQKLLEDREDAHDLRLIREVDARNIGKPRVSQAEVNKMFGI